MTRPDAISVDPDGIPPLLKSANTWLCWRYVRGSAGKWTKPPFMASNPARHASTTNPSTWTTFSTAIATYLDPCNQFDGVGLVLTGGLVGIDLDHVIVNGNRIDLWACEVRDHFAETYIEWSPSAEGLRIFALGTPQRCGKGGPENHLEVYDKHSPRYMTVTGHRLRSCAEVITDAQTSLNWLHATHMHPKPSSPTRPLPAPARADDDAIIARSLRAANGSKFSRLFEGDAGDDHSRADLALCSMLAFRTSDRAQIDRIFRRSGLMRDKWDSRRGASTYGEMTIAKAIGR